MQFILFLFSLFVLKRSADSFSERSLSLDNGADKEDTSKIRVCTIWNWKELFWDVPNQLFKNHLLTSSRLQISSVHLYTLFQNGDQ